MIEYVTSNFSTRGVQSVGLASDALAKIRGGETTSTSSRNAISACFTLTTHSIEASSLRMRKKEKKRDRTRVDFSSGVLASQEVELLTAVLQEVQATESPSASPAHCNQENKVCWSQAVAMARINASARTYFIIVIRYVKTDAHANHEGKRGRRGIDWTGFNGFIRRNLMSFQQVNRCSLHTAVLSFVSHMKRVRFHTLPRDLSPLSPERALRVYPQATKNPNSHLSFVPNNRWLRWCTRVLISFWDPFPLFQLSKLDLRGIYTPPLSKRLDQRLMRLWFQHYLTNILFTKKSPTSLENLIVPP